MIDRCCGANFIIKDLLTMERALVERYNRLYLTGHYERSIKHLLIILNLRKNIKGSKGYETHNFS